MFRVGSASVALATLILGSTGAMAATVTFTGNGSFSNVTNCGDGSPGCSITNSGNKLNMSGSDGFFGPSSSITITDESGSFSVPPVQNDVTIGKLTWVNLPTQNTDQNFDVTYTFTLSFTSPSNSSDTQAFALDITQPTNPPGDNVAGISNVTLANLGPFSLNGITVSDIKFQLAAGSDGSYNGSTWSDPENDTSTLLITADFAPTATPLPAALPLFAGGLGMIGLLGRRKKRKTANIAA
jgi:hypothetical protein